MERRRLGRYFAAVLAVLGIAGVWYAKSSTGGESIAVAASMSQSEFDQRVRTYLLEHPEIIGEALNRLEEKRGEQEAAAAKAILAAHNGELYQDPDSPVGGNPSGGVS